MEIAVNESATTSDAMLRVSTAGPLVHAEHPQLVAVGAFSPSAPSDLELRVRHISTTEKKSIDGLADHIRELNVDNNLEVLIEQAAKFLEPRKPRIRVATLSEPKTIYKRELKLERAPQVFPCRPAITDVSPTGQDWIPGYYSVEVGFNARQSFFVDHFWAVDDDLCVANGLEQLDQPAFVPFYSAESMFSVSDLIEEIVVRRLSSLHLAGRDTVSIDITRPCHRQPDYLGIRSLLSAHLDAVVGYAERFAFADARISLQSLTEFDDGNLRFLVEATPSSSEGRLCFFGPHKLEDFVLINSLSPQGDVARIDREFDDSGNLVRVSIEYSYRPGEIRSMER